VHIVSLAEMVLARLDQGLLNGLQKRIFADGLLFFQNLQRLFSLFIHFFTSAWISSI